MQRAKFTSLIGCCLTAVLCACRSAHTSHVEATSLLGTPLTRTPLDSARLEQAQRNLEDAARAWERNPRDLEATIWYGRRLAYMGRFQEAVEIYTRGLFDHPHSAALLRHRGHRFITLRRLDDAVRDLSLAARIVEGQPDEVEPDGMPNAAGIARSTLKSNIYYHLGLAHYLRGEWELADKWFGMRQGLDAWNDDMLVSTTHWRWLALCRAGRDDDAARLLEDIHPGLDVIENTTYHNLCLFYKGMKLSEEIVRRDADGTYPEPGVAYGVATWKALQGMHESAQEMYISIVSRSPWTSFGTIAAEAELARRAKMNKKGEVRG